MVRLTYENNNGYIYFVINGEKVTINDVNILKVAQKLKEYEDLDEQGLLFRLPCKVGDTLYAIGGKRIQVLKAKNDISIFSGKLHILSENFVYADYISYDMIGKTVFLTREEADQKLKEMESD